ncbi:MAG: ribonuclease J [Lachnospiraceae bacterium]|nr:ribonuclease J [Lachnospiraceae bacterium]
MSKNQKLKIIPLGGLETIGMNITAFEYGDSIIVVDCGLAFPEDDMLGIDLVIPDVTYLKDNIERVKGFVITHGHEDHIGALPFVIGDVNVPIYTTALTMALIEHKLREHDLLDTTKRYVVKHGDIVELGAFKVEFIKTNHSIQDASALAIFSPAGTVVHTGDFKVDYTPVYGDAIDLQRLAEIGKSGVLALMSDSTNAEEEGFTMSEKTVGNALVGIFSEYQDTRLIIATFASNVDRVQQIINIAHKFGRKVVVQGRSMVNVIGIASEMGYIRIPYDTIIDPAELDEYPEEQTVIITTGSQGEAMAGLSRMADGTHRVIHIKPTDTVVFSSNPIPGNEKAVSNIINALSARHANIIFQDVHVSGHARREELKLIYSLVHPQYALPVHGEYRHLRANAQVAVQLGIPKDHIMIMHSGDVLEINQDGAEVVDQVQARPILVDGTRIGDVSKDVMRDRKQLAQDGVVVAVIPIDMKERRMTAAPKINSRGFVFLTGDDTLIEEACETLKKTVERKLSDDKVSKSKLKESVRSTLINFMLQETGRKPLVMPILLDVADDSEED